MHGLLPQATSGLTSVVAGRLQISLVWLEISRMPAADPSLAFSNQAPLAITKAVRLNRGACQDQVESGNENNDREGPVSNHKGQDSD